MRGGDRRAGGAAWVLAACVALSTAPITAKLALRQGNDPTTLITLRILVGSLALWLLVAVLRPGRFRIGVRDWSWCAAAGAANAVSMLCYYIGLREVDASLATLLFSAYPAAVLLQLWLAGERATALSLVRLVLALAGVALLVGDVGGATALGVLLILAAVVTFALHVNLVQWRLRHLPVTTVTLHVVTAMGGCLVLWWLATQGPAPRWPDPLGWGVVVWTGLVATAFARFAIFTGIQRIGSGQTALLGPVETMCIVAGAVLFLGERLALQALLGGLLVLGSAMLAGWRSAARAAALRTPEPDAAAGADPRSR